MTTDEIAETQGTVQSLRPSRVPGSSVAEIIQWLDSIGVASSLLQTADTTVTGITIDSREVQPGDLYVALPGAKAHGAQFSQTAIASGAVAILTDRAGMKLMGELSSGIGYIQSENLRKIVGPLSAKIYNSQPAGHQSPTLFAVTGTNGKTTTTYMLNSIMEQLGNSTGLIGTIEILAGGTPIPSKLTTPESPHVHSLIALMRQRGISTMSMEVSSHALDYRRVDGVKYHVAGFTNLTQDHLDLHGTMENYCSSKAELFTPDHTRKAVITVEDNWGEAMLARAQQKLGEEKVVALYTNHGAGLDKLSQNLGRRHWALTDVRPEGIGHTFTLVKGDGTRLQASTQLPANFNVSNAALAVTMVCEAGVDPTLLQQVLSQPQTLTPVVPGRMQLISTEPVAIVDFAHNPDALQRSLEALDSARRRGKIIIVFGATGERDHLKRPIMGDIAARFADIVVVTDDDPHDEDPAPIRAEVEAGALRAQRDGARVETVLNIAPRPAAIAKAIGLATTYDSVLVAGRGHEVSQEVAGVNLELDDRVEVAHALRQNGFNILPAYRSMLEEASR